MKKPKKNQWILGTEGRKYVYLSEAHDITRSGVPYWRVFNPAYQQIHAFHPDNLTALGPMFKTPKGPWKKV